MEKSGCFQGCLPEASGRILLVFLSAVGGTMILPKVSLSCISLSPSLCLPHFPPPNLRYLVLCLRCQHLPSHQESSHFGLLSHTTCRIPHPLCSDSLGCFSTVTPGIPQTRFVRPALMAEHLWLVRTPTPIFGLGCCSPFLDSGIL